MNLLSVDSITRKIGDKVLFSNASFGIEEGDRIALIGTNGSGKTTLLRTIMGLDELDSGKVVKKTGLRIGYLEQDPSFNPDHTVKDHILNGEGDKLNLVRKYLSLTEAIRSNPSPENQDSLDKVTDLMNREEGWKLESDMRSFSAALDIPDLDAYMKELSGGLKRKASIVRLLLSDYDLVLLDEPTNHLDLPGIRKLERILSRSSQSILMVTHDRYFMENVADKIMEIDAGQIFIHQGFYSEYLEKKAAQQEANKKARENLKKYVKSELDWIRRQPQARGTKQKARIDRFEDAVDTVSRTKVKENNMEFSVSGRRQGKKILELESVSYGYDTNTLFNNFSHTFRAGEKIGIIGPNGCGKTTLMEIIAGNIQPREGNVDRGVNTHIGYFDQTTKDLTGDYRIIEYVKNEFGELLISPDGSKITAGDLLEYFQFPPSVQYTHINKLSGGEKRRLYLAGTLLRNPNFLLLDEPTNDLDAVTLGLLESFLESFGGVIVTVSHDRFFLDRITGMQFAFQPNGEIIKFPGNCSEFLEFQENQNIEKKKNSPGQKEKEIRSKEKTKLSYKEAKELQTIEAEIQKLEQEMADLESNMNSGDSDYKKLEQWGARHSEIESILEEKLERWDYLSSFPS